MRAGIRFFRAVRPGSAFPKGDRAEVAFCGRSNVGKSSLLNALTGIRGLARTSRTPGRTREVHFYEQGHDRFLVDLPGYGYARVSRSEQQAWGALVESYFERRERIALAILLVDSRHDPFPTDLMLSEGLASRGIPFLVVPTKTDKATMAEKARLLTAMRGSFPGAEGFVPTSARTGRGIRDLARAIDRAVLRLREQGKPGIIKGLEEASDEAGSAS